MTNWRLRIEGVPNVLDRWPDEPIEEVSRGIAEVVRPQIEAADMWQLSRDAKREGLQHCDDFARMLPAEDLFKVVLSHFYDWADAYEVWVEPI